VLTDQFDRHVREVMAEKPAWFKGVEPPARESDVTRVEAKLGYALPEQFKHFATTFGGGYFGGVNISTLDEHSDWYVLSRPPIKFDDLPMLIVSDDEAGGYYGFVLRNGACESDINYLNPADGSYKESTVPSFFEFIEKYALSI
jgi:SMI1-KNR4 cell-wall